jgi:hypothetical protein
MSLIKYGGGVIQMSGRIAGNVFARNRYGNYVRAGTVPKNAKTPFQVTVRAVMSYLAAKWGAVLTPAERTAWDLYGSSVPMLNRLGESIFLSGMNHYVRSNASLIQADLAEVTAAPVIFSLPESDPTFAAAISAATQQIACTFDEALPWCKEATSALIVSMGKPIIASKSFFDAPFRYAGTVDGVASTGAQSPANVACSFVATANQKVVVRAKVVRGDGRVSNYFRDDCIVGA